MNKEDIGLATKELKIQSGNCHVRETAMLGKLPKKRTADPIYLIKEYIL